MAPSTTTAGTSIPVGEAHRRLDARGLKRMEGSTNREFEIWIWPDGYPEIINYDDENCQFFHLQDVEDVLERSKP